MIMNGLGLFLGVTSLIFGIWIIWAVAREYFRK